MPYCICRGKEKTRCSVEHSSLAILLLTEKPSDLFLCEDVSEQSFSCLFPKYTHAFLDVFERGALLGVYLLLLLDEVALILENHVWPVELPVPQTAQIVCLLIIVVGLTIFNSGSQS